MLVYEVYVRRKDINFLRHKCQLKNNIALQIHLPIDMQGML